MQPHEQLIVGVATGLTFCALLRFTPLWRELLAAITAAVLIPVLISDPTLHRLDVASAAGRLPEAVLDHPHFALGLALAAVGVLAVLNMSRLK